MRRKSIMNFAPLTVRKKSRVLKLTIDTLKMSASLVAPNAFSNIKDMEYIREKRIHRFCSTLRRTRQCDHQCFVDKPRNPSRQHAIMHSLLPVVPGSFHDAGNLPGKQRPDGIGCQIPGRKSGSTNINQEITSVRRI